MMWKIFGLARYIIAMRVFTRPMKLCNLWCVVGRGEGWEVGSLSSRSKMHTLIMIFQTTNSNLIDFNKSSTQNQTKFMRINMWLCTLHTCTRLSSIDSVIEQKWNGTSCVRDVYQRSKRVVNLLQKHVSRYPFFGHNEGHWPCHSKMETLSVLCGRQTFIAHMIIIIIIIIARADKWVKSSAAVFPCSVHIHIMARCLACIRPCSDIVCIAIVLSEKLVSVSLCVCLLSPDIYFTRPCGPLPHSTMYICFCFYRKSLEIIVFHGWKRSLKARWLIYSYILQQ